LQLYLFFFQKKSYLFASSGKKKEKGPKLTLEPNGPRQNLQNLLAVQAELMHEHGLHPQSPLLARRRRFPIPPATLQCASPDLPLPPRCLQIRVSDF
jgi:hypothetical protein